MARPAPGPSARPGRRSCLAVLPLVLLSIMAFVTITRLSNNLAVNGPFKRELKQTFTRFSPYDSLNELLNTYVTFFRIASSTTPIAPALIRSFIYASFLPPVLILALEARKRSNQLWIQYSFVPVGLIAQTCSAMFTLPLWFAAYLMLGPGQSGRESARGDRGDDLRAVLPATVVGYVLPAILIDNPLVPLSRETQDWLNAAWQLFPVTIPLLAALLESVLPASHAAAHSVEQGTLLWASAICRLMHLSTLYELLRHAIHNRLDWRQLASLAVHPVRKVSPLQRSVYEFLLTDIALSAAATAVFILLAPRGGDPRRQTSRLKLALVMVLSGPVQGMGAGLIWGWRTVRQDAARGAGRRTDWAQSEANEG